MHAPSVKQALENNVWGKSALAAHLCKGFRQWLLKVKATLWWKSEVRTGKAPCAACPSTSELVHVVHNAAGSETDPARFRNLASTRSSQRGPQVYENLLSQLFNRASTQTQTCAFTSVSFVLLVYPCSPILQGNEEVFLRKEDLVDILDCHMFAADLAIACCRMRAASSLPCRLRVWNMEYTNGPGTKFGMKRLSQFLGSRWLGRQMQLFEQTASGIVAATPESSDTLSNADLASLRQTPGVYEAYQGLGKLSGSLRVLASWPAANMRERERERQREREKTKNHRGSSNNQKDEGGKSHQHRLDSEKQRLSVRRLKLRFCAAT